MSEQEGIELTTYDIYHYGAQRAVSITPIETRTDGEEYWFWRKADDPTTVWVSALNEDAYDDHIPLRTLLLGLGITLEDCKKALEEQSGVLQGEEQSGVLQGEEE